MRKPKPKPLQQRKPEPNAVGKPGCKSNVATAQPPDDNLLLERLRRHLAFLGLNQTVSNLDDLLDWATRQRPGYTGLLEHVLSAEVDHKSENRIARRFLMSGMPERKTLEAFDWDFQPSIDKDFIIELGRLDFVRRHDDLIITGPTRTNVMDVYMLLVGE